MRNASERYRAKELARDAERWRQYVICRERGHQPDGFVTAGVPPKRVCRHCGTYYWTEQVYRESGVPTDPEESAC